MDEKRLKLSPFTWAFLALLVLFTFLRVQRLSERVLHNDEGVNSMFTINLIRHGDYKYDPTNYHGPSLYFFQLIPSWASSFLHHPTKFKFKDPSGVTVFTMRFSVVVTSLLVLVCIYMMRGFLGRWGALLAVFLTGLSCDFLYFSRYFIHEMMVVLFTFGVYLSFIFLKKTGRVIFYYAFCCCVALLFATKETFIIHLVVLLIAYVLAALCARDRVNIFTEMKGLVKQLGPHLSHGLVVGLVVWALLFTSFLTNPKGLIDSFAAYFTWTKEGVTSGHNKIWSYYLKELIIPYEWPLLIAAIPGIIVAAVKRDRFGVFLAFWTVGIISAYSIIPYKTPWLIINFIVPMALVAGYGFNQIIQSTGTAVIVPVIVATLTLHAIQFPETWRINTSEGDLEKHKQAYVHTSRDIFRLVARIDELAQKTGEGKNMKINLVSPEYWPIPFYLWEYTQALYWGSMANVKEYDAPVIVAIPGQHSELQSKVRDSYSVETFVLRPGTYIDLWINNKFAEGLKPEEPKMELKTSLSVPERKIKPGLVKRVYANSEFKEPAFSVTQSATDFNFFYDSEAKRPAPSPFSVSWKGYIRIPTAGQYRFSLDSDDGSWLIIDDKVVVNNGGTHGMMRVSRKVDLSDGYHKIELRYNDVGGFSQLKFYWMPPTKSEEPVPAEFFSSEGS